MISRILFVMLFFIAGSEVAAGGICHRLSEHSGYLKEERNYLLRVCNMSPSNATGSLIYIENGFLPILDEFYLKVPQRDEIALVSSRSPNIESFEAKMNWPYRVIWIRRDSEDKEKSDEVRKRTIISEELSRAAEMCGFRFSLSYYQEKAPGLDFVGEFFELKIGDTLILFGGGSEALAIVTGEMFAQNNCQ